MFRIFGKKSQKEEIGAPIEGEAVESAEISDPTFQKEMLGKAIAIKPWVGKVFAPADGTIAMVFETKHAVSLITDQGAEILIHIGLDTVTLNGQYFTEHVRVNEKVKKGDLLLEFDLEGIKEAGLDLISPIIICNSEDYREIQRITGRAVKPGDTIMELEK